MLKKEHKDFLDKLLPEYNPDGCICEVSGKIWERNGDVKGVGLVECLEYLSVRKEEIQSKE